MKVFIKVFLILIFINSFVIASESENLTELEEQGNEINGTIELEEQGNEIIELEEQGNEIIELEEQGNEINEIIEEANLEEMFAKFNERRGFYLSKDGKYLWHSTNRGGLIKRDSKTGEIIKSFTNTEGLQSNQIVSILELSSSNENSYTLYIGTLGGVSKIVNDELVDIVFDLENAPYPIALGYLELFHNRIVRSFIELNDVVYAQTLKGILKIVNGDLERVIEEGIPHICSHEPPCEIDEPITSDDFDTDLFKIDNEIYVGVANKSVIDKTSWTAKIVDDQIVAELPISAPNDLLKVDNSLFIAFDGKVVEVVNDEIVNTITINDGLSSISEIDKLYYFNNAIYVVGWGGVAKLEKGIFYDDFIKYGLNYILTTNDEFTDHCNSLVEVNDEFYVTCGVRIWKIKAGETSFGNNKDKIISIIPISANNLLEANGIIYGELNKPGINNEAEIMKLIPFATITPTVTSKQNISLTWFLHKTPFFENKIKYLELQRGLSVDGNYEPVLDSNGKHITFSVNYEDKTLEDVYDNYFPIIEGHTIIDETDKKGYNLNTPIIDREWLEGVPRYYRLVAIYENENEQIFYNSFESAYVYFENRYKPRVDVKSLYGDNLLIEDRNYTISLELNSIDLYEGNISFEVNSTNLNIQNEILKQLQDINFSASERKYIDINISKKNISKDENITLDCNATEDNLTITLNYIETDEKVVTFSFLKERDTRVRASDPLAFKVQTNFAGNFILKDLEDGTILKEFDIADSNRSVDMSLILPMPKDYKLQIQKSDGTIVSNELVVTALKAKREVYVENAEKLEKGKTVVFNGKISPFDKAIDVDTQVNPRELSGETTKVTAYLNTEDGRVIRLMDDSIGVNNDGTFNFNLNILENGTLSLKIESGSNSFGLATSLSSQLIAGNAIGEAIVVVGYNTDEDINTISTSLGDYTVKSLLKREIPLNQIKYLHFTDGHSLVTSAGTINAESLTKTNLEEAITIWIQQHLHSTDPYKKPLTIYLIGFDTEENAKAIYKLNTDENLLVEDLNCYLNTLQTKINNALTTDTYKGHLPVNIIVEGANSGSWIDGLKHKGVIIITSANKKESGGVSNISNEAKSFTKRFYNYIAQGKDIESSFAEAEYQILKDFNKVQEPQLEANGNGIANEEEDRRRVRGQFLESRPLNNERPIITNYRNNTLLNKNFNYRLYLEAIDNDGDVIESFAEVEKPNGEITLVSLAQNAEVNSLFTKEFRDFSEIGVYEVRYFARDSQDNYSLSKRSILKLNNFNDLCGLNEKYENGQCILKNCEIDNYNCPICVGEQTLDKSANNGFGTCIDPVCGVDKKLVDGNCIAKTCKDDSYNCPQCIGNQTLDKSANNGLGVCINPTCGTNQYLENGKCVDKIITSSGTSVGFGGGGGGSSYTPPLPMPKNIDSNVKANVKSNSDGSTTTIFDTITLYDKKVDIDSILTKDGEILNIIDVIGKNGITLQTKVNLPKDTHMEVTENGEIISTIDEIENGDIKIEPTVKTKSDGSTENSIKVVKNGKTLNTIINTPAGSEVEVTEKGEVITKMAKIEGKDITVEPTLKSDSEGKSESSIKITKNKKVVETKIKTPIGAKVEASSNGKIIATSPTVKSNGKEIQSRVTFEPTTGDISTEFIIKNTMTGKYEFIDIPKGFAGAEINLIEKENSMEIVMQTPIAQKLKLRNIRVYEKYKLRDINEDFTYLVPNSDDAKVEIKKDALSEDLNVILLNGEASIVYPNGEEEELVLNKSVTVPEKREERVGLLLNIGWNLLSTPLDTEIYTNIAFEYCNKNIWRYKGGVWEKNPYILKAHEGFWVKSSYKMTKTITGYSYEFNPKVLEEGWNLAGTGQELINPKKTYSFKEVWIYETKNNEWINNPEIISQGQGFWVKK